MSAKQKMVSIENLKSNTIDNVSKPKRINKRLVLMGFGKGIDGLVVLEAQKSKNK